MSADPGFLVALLRELTLVVRPLRDALQEPAALSDLLLRHGWVANPSSLNLPAIRELIDIEDDLQAIDRVLDRITETPLDQLPAIVPQALRDLNGVITTVRGLATLGSQAVGFPFDQGAFWKAFPAELIDGLVVGYLECWQPILFVPLLGLGVVEEDAVDLAGVPGRASYVQRRLRLDRLGLVVDPPRLARDAYGWGEPKLKRERLVDVVTRVGRLLGLPAEEAAVRPDLLDAYFPVGHADREAIREARVVVAGRIDDQGNGIDAALSVVPIPAAGELPAGLAVAPSVHDDVAITWGDVTLALRATGTFGDRLELRPGGAQIVGGATQIAIAASIDYRPREPAILLGSATSHRLELEDANLALDVSGDAANPTVRIRAGADRLRAVIAAGESDGFLQRVLGEEPTQVEFSGALVWSNRSGLHFEGQAGLELSVPVDVQIGIAELRAVTLGVHAGDGGLGVTAGVTAAARLGPVAATLENLGVALTISGPPADQAAGTFGDLDIAVAFKPPSGVGLAIDAEIVRGGGFVYFNPARGQYSGVLQLELAKTISLKAFGLISTRMPDGSPGFSLFVLITAEGFTPIQLGLGFTLNGVGGLLGINRSVNVEPLRTGLKSGTLDSVLFPADPARNAPAILNTLDTVFPAHRDHYVLGPMAIIGWGNPPLLTLKLALLLEFPDPTRLILLGRLSALLPSAEEPVARIQVDAIGVLDFDKGELSLDASLFDSRIAEFVLTGDMALRIGWGAEPQFMLSVGGFNPRFPAPPGLRPLERLAITLAESDNPRLRLEAYLAITSNTLQFGARLELHAKKGPFSLEGHLGFDALVQFAPFGFVVDFSASVAVRFGGQVVLSVLLEVTLSGPSPWRAVGTASFRFLLIAASVAFDVQIGDGEPPAAPELVDVRDLLARALADPRNWASTLPQDAPPLVSFRDAAERGTARVHPLAVLVVHQRVVPLNQRITRYGSGRLREPQTFTLSLTDRAGAALPFDVTPVKDAFARGQYEDLRDDEKLSLPSFEPMDSGLRIGVDEHMFGDVRDVPEGYETRLWDPVIDPDPPPRPEHDEMLAGTIPEPRRLALSAGLRP